MDRTTSYTKQLCYVLFRCNLNDTFRLLDWHFINNNRYGLFTKSLTTNQRGDMITYEVMQRIEGDTEKHSNYELVQYEFPFPENSVLIERDKEMNRILNKPIIITTSNNNNCQQQELIMATQQTFVPYTESKSVEDRIAYVKANPHKYMPKAQYDLVKSLHNKIEALDSKMNEILAKKQIVGYTPLL